MDLEISEMTLSDLEKISDNLQTDFDDFWNLQIFKYELANTNSYYIIAKLDNQIVGFGGIWKAVDVMHITNIVIRKDKRNLGIASKILEQLINISIKQNMHSLTLEVNQNNVNAIKLYEKYNFEKEGIRKNYYRNKDSAIIMTLDLR